VGSVCTSEKEVQSFVEMMIVPGVRFPMFFSFHTLLSGYGRLCMISSETYWKTVSFECLRNVSLMLCVCPGAEFGWKAILQTFGPPHWNAGFLSSLSDFRSLLQFVSFPDLVQELCSWKIPEAKVSLG